MTTQTKSWTDKNEVKSTSERVGGVACSQMAVPSYKVQRLEQAARKMEDALKIATAYLSSDSMALVKAQEALQLFKELNDE